MIKSTIKIFNEELFFNSLWQKASNEQLLIGPLLIARSPAKVCFVLVVVLGGKRTRVVL